MVRNVKIMENTIKMNDLGGNTPILETPTYPPGSTNIAGWKIPNFPGRYYQHSGFCNQLS